MQEQEIGEVDEQVVIKVGLVTPSVVETIVIEPALGEPLQIGPIDDAIVVSSAKISWRICVFEFFRRCLVVSILGIKLDFCHLILSRCLAEIIQQHIP